jgi:hypothetical protein
MMGNSIILDDAGNPRTVDTWAAGEIIRLRKEIEKLEERVKNQDKALRKLSDVLTNLITGGNDNISDGAADG